MSTSGTATLKRWIALLLVLGLLPTASVLAGRVAGGFQSIDVTDNVVVGDSVIGSGTGSITGFNIPLYLTEYLSVYDAITAWEDVRKHGAVGDNTADDTTKIQAAHDAAPYGIVFYPKPSVAYKITDTITISPYQKIVGASTAGVIINMTDATKYAYQYIPTVGATTDDQNYGLVFDSMTIRAKYGIKVNTNGTLLQAIHHFMTFRNLNMEGTSAGVYGYHPNLMSPLDDNTGTAVVPSLNELVGYGVGINITQGFNTIIENSRFRFYGIANYLENDDISTVKNNRYEVNARFLHIIANNSYGNHPKIENNEFLGPERVGGIYLDAVPNPVISKNFFEPTNAGGQILTEVGGYGMSFVFNNFSTNQTSTPIISIDPQYDMLFEGNNYYTGVYTVSPFEMLTTQYASTYSNRATFYNNNWRFNSIIDNVPFVKMQPVNKRLFNYNNVQGTVSLAGDTSFPFEANPVSGNWSLHTASGYVTITDFPTELTDLNLLVKITATPETAGDTSMTISWGGVSVFSGNLNFDNNSLVETKHITIRRPTAVMPGSILTFLLDNFTTNAYLEGIELVPVNYLLGTAAPTDNAYKFGVGDTVYNTAADNVLGWKCNVAGSPGTWKYMQVTLEP